MVIDKELKEKLAIQINRMVRQGLSNIKTEVDEQAQKVILIFDDNNGFVRQLQKNDKSVEEDKIKGFERLINENDPTKVKYVITFDWLSKLDKYKV